MHDPITTFFIWVALAGVAFLLSQIATIPFRRP